MGDADNDGMTNGWEDTYVCMDSENGADAHYDYSDNGWTNWAVYHFYDATGIVSDPCEDVAGQAIPLKAGYNMVSFTVDTTYGFTAYTEWDAFFENALVGGLANLDFVAVWGSGFKYYYPGVGVDTGFSIASSKGFWVVTNAADLLVLEGSRVRFTSFTDPSYASFNLQSGWNQVGVLPMNRFYYTGGMRDGSDLPGPTDLQYATSYSTRAEMLQAAFGIQTGDWNKVLAIQMLYPDSKAWGYGPMLSYTKGLADHFNTLDFVLTGYGAWIQCSGPITLAPVQPVRPGEDGPAPTPAP